MHRVTLAGSICMWYIINSFDNLLRISFAFTRFLDLEVPRLVGLEATRTFFARARSAALPE